LEEQNKKGSETSTSGINFVEINIAVSSSDSWVFDTRLMQGLSLTRRFAKSELDVCVSNGAKVVAIAVGTYCNIPATPGLAIVTSDSYLGS
jgi:hypothetical protein